MEGASNPQRNRLASPFFFVLIPLLRPEKIVELTGIEPATS